MLEQYTFVKALQEFGKELGALETKSLEDIYKSQTGVCVLFPTRPAVSYLLY